MGATCSAMDTLITSEIRDLHDTAANLQHLYSCSGSPDSQHSLAILAHSWQDLQERMDRLERMLDAMEGEYSSERDFSPFTPLWGQAAA